MVDYMIDTLRIAFVVFIVLFFTLFLYGPSIAVLLGVIGIMKDIFTVIWDLLQYLLCV